LYAPVTEDRPGRDGGLYGRGAGRLRVRRHANGDGHLIELDGEIDMATVGPLNAELLELAAAGTPLMVDLSGIVFVDSTGLRLLIGVDREMARSGLRLVIRRPSEPVRRLLEVTALASWLEVHD
jgi:anti-sigma B factor antagonist